MEFIQVLIIGKRGGPFLLAPRDFDASKYTVYDPAAPRVDGPTIEEWTAAGYLPTNYPPDGYAEVASPGLEAYRDDVAARAAAEEAKAAEAIAATDETNPSTGETNVAAVAPDPSPDDTNAVSGETVAAPPVEEATPAVAEPKPRAPRRNATR